MKTKQLTDEILGQRVGKAIYSYDGHLLIKTGTTINNDILNKLERHAIDPVDILNALTGDVQQKGIISDEEMNESIDVVKRVFENVLHNDENGVSSAIPPEQMKLVKETIDNLIEALSKTENLLYTVSDMLENAAYTYKHSVNVTILSILTAKALDYRDYDIRNIALGAFLHDIGKMLVDQNLITKPGNLSNIERKEVNNHAQYGYDLIKDIKDLPYTAKLIVLLHHEKLDGTGYPFGLKGIEIPEYVRIVTICDMYDAMTTDRVYRGKMPIYSVLEILMTDAVYKLDRKVYRHMTENICIFPPGSGVVLSDGRVGIVTYYRATNPSRPHVRVINLDKDLTDIKTDYVNLEKIKTLFVIDTWDVSEFRKVFKPKIRLSDALPQINITKEQLLFAK